MADKNNMFEGYQDPGIVVGDGFEEAVFKKIKVKKRRRRATVTSLSAFLLGGVIFIAQNNIFRSNPQPKSLAAGSGKAKQEVMLTDDVVLATYDGQNNYIIDSLDNGDDISI